MFENLYTTKMSSNKKIIHRRFSKIISGRSEISKMLSLVMPAMIVLTVFGASIAAAAVVGERKNCFIDGKGYSIEPILLENKLATHNDNWYVPLRKTFEALGYTVDYDVDKTQYTKRMSRYYDFPVYDTEIYRELTDEDGAVVVIDSNGFEWHKQYVTDDINYYIYGATYGFNRQMPIIEMTKDGKTEFCQIGSREYSSSYALAPVLINGTAYLPIRAVAEMIGGEVGWNDEQHDTYFAGALTFDENTGVIVITTK